jgi:hypothetical protein
VAPYPFCTIEPNVGVVPVPDARLDVLARMIRPDKVTPATVKFVDIAGLVGGASRGEGLGNRFLGHIREVDAVVHVVRLFADPQVAHVEGRVDPVRDVQMVDTELCLADLEVVARRLERIEKPARSRSRADYRDEVAVLRRIEERLDAGVPVRLQSLAPREREAIRELHLLTARPVLYVANVAETALGQPADPALEALLAHARTESAPVVVLSAAFEAELAGLEPEDRELFLRDAGLDEPSLHVLVRTGYRLLGLVTFFTTRLPELRAWTVKDGITALAAAGKIHTDFARGFIRAEVISFDELVSAGDPAAARERGLVRTEGRDYLVRDGDVIHFRFNVTT